MTKRPQHGWIELPEIGNIPALVELGAGYATAVLLVRPLRALADVVGRQVAIDLATDRGLLRFDARVAGIRDGDVLDLDVAGDQEVIQRRAYARVDVVLDVTVAPVANGAGTITSASAAVNISGSGAILSHLHGFAPGDPIELTVQLAALEPPMVISGRVVREADDHRWAVHFERMHQADRERIVRFIFGRQRLELQRVRRP